MEIDYKKKYEEALERASHIKGNDTATVATAKEVVELLFPELKDDEDERIRNAVVKHFKEHEKEFGGSTFGGYYYKDIFDWLERQKHVGSDNAVIDEAISLINTLASGYGVQVTEPITFSGVDMINGVKKRLRAIRLQAKQEWSEEDEKKLESISRVLIGCDTAERMLKIDGYSIVDIAGWLKSLRPQPRWKPTKEQMEALKYFIPFHRPQANAAVEGWKEFNNLESLYNDLQKL